MKMTLFALAVVLQSFTAHAVDMQKLVGDTQRMNQEPSKIVLVWWIPLEFWRESLRDNPRITKEQAEDIFKILDGYMIFSVAAVDIGPMASMTAKSRVEVEANTELSINGKAIPPLQDEQISSGALNFVSIMKPMMANMLGQFGQGMQFLVYPNPPAGSVRIEATLPGAFSYTAFGHRYDWRLPLGSLLLPKIDAKTNEEFPGNYLYNPYTGDKLIATPAVAPPKPLSDGTLPE